MSDFFQLPPAATQWPQFFPGTKMATNVKFQVVFLSSIEIHFLPSLLISHRRWRNSYTRHVW
jgi:hypothetical protein